MHASSQCSEALEQRQEPIGAGAQRPNGGNPLRRSLQEEDQFDELELALEKASGTYQEELGNGNTPLCPISTKVVAKTSVVQPIIDRFP